MNKILAALAILVFATAANAAGAPSSVEIAPVRRTATLNAVCSTPATGCAAGTGLAIPLGGRSTAGLQLNSTAFNGTITPYVSWDGGVNWKATTLRNNGDQVATATASSVALNETAIRWLVANIPWGVATDVMFAVTTYTSGSTIAVITGSNVASKFGDSVSTTKGVQTSLAIPTQDFKDSGRSYVAIGADGVTPAIAETVITFTKVVADTSTAAQTSYTITNAKTFRIQSICASFTAGATANRVRVAVRLNTGGACVAGSNILLPVAELAPNYGTATAAEGGASVCMPIPDGLEIAGNGTKAICLSESATAAAGTLTMTLVGYEY